MTAPARPGLTRRQAEVLLLAANGNTNAQIARWRGVTPNSVSEILAAAYRALGVADRAQAVAVALRLELLRLDDVIVPGAVGLEVQHRHEGRQKAA